MDVNVEYCVVVKIKFGLYRIIMGVEMDCYDISFDGRRYFVEFKMSWVLDVRIVDKFEWDKLLKFWI